jgi:hypothetical protein
MTDEALHYVTDMPHGADCSCGRRFSIWDMTNSRRHNESWKFKNLARANARRHAAAANKKLA